MKVLMFHHSYTAGGAARHVRDLHRGISAHGAATEVWSAREPVPAVEGVRGICKPWEGFLYPMELVPHWSDWRHRGSITQLRAPLLARFDLLHLHLLAGGWCSMKAVHQACKLRPAIWTHHDEWAAFNGLSCNLTGKISKEEAIAKLGGYHRWLQMSPYHESFKSRGMGKLLDRWTPNPALHIAPSEHIAKLIRQTPRFGNPQVVVIPHGTTLADHPQVQMDRGLARRKWNVPDQAKVILLSSFHVHDLHKGFDLAVNALHQLHTRTPVHVLLLGRGAEAFSERLAPIPCTTGYVENDVELITAYRAADLTLIPSFAESFSYVALESSACETPFVSFAVGGLVERALHGTAGNLARCFDVDDLAAQIRDLLEHPQRRLDMGRAGRDWVVHESTMELMLRRTVEAYEHAIERFNADRIR